ANAVIDLEQYIVDLRLTFFAMIVGLIAGAVTAALQAPTAHLPDMRLGVTGLAMALAWLATAWIGRMCSPASAPAMESAAPPAILPESATARDALIEPGLADAASTADADRAPQDDAALSNPAEGAAPAPQSPHVWSAQTSAV